VKVASLGTGVKAVAAGSGFSLALMKDGTVRSWGDNFYGQLGNGADPFGDEPGPVGNLSNVKAIATDGDAAHVLALLENGTVRSWGRNNDGQLGDGSILPGTSRETPVRVANLTGVEAVAVGGHSLALLASGRVKSCGDNNYGELGNGTHGFDTDRSTPVNVTGLDNVRSISAGTYDSLAILETGRARSWGNNFHGQLGNGTSGDAADSDLPAGVKNLTGIRNMDGGDGFALAATQ